MNFLFIINILVVIIINSINYGKKLLILVKTYINNNEIKYSN